MKTSKLIEDIPTPVKELANSMGLSKELIYKWREDERSNPIDRTEALMKASDNNDIINYLASSTGGYFIETPKDTQAGYEVCAGACKEFGELMVTMGRALEDGEITKDEYVDISKEWADLVNVMHGFLSKSKSELYIDLKY